MTSDESLQTTRIEKTFCRICEALCGLEVEIKEHDEVKKIRPDKTHPVSKGYACIKGINLGAMHHDPARLNHPLKRTEHGLERISWKQAISEIGEKIRHLKKHHGPRALGMYAGNPTFFNFANVLFVHDFLKALGSPNFFASHSIDVNNKLFTSMKIYGRSMVHFLPDFENTRFLMCLGTNPVVSQMSVLSLPNALERIKAIETRGGRVVMIDPRRTETAEKIGEHKFIRPGTDIYLLLAMLHVLVEEKKPDPAEFNDVANGINQFLGIAKHWTPERCAKLTGISAGDITALARSYLQAEGAALYMSTGVNMGPFGSLCYWLIQGLSLLSGNLDKKGGQIFYQGAFDALDLAKKLHIGGEEPERTLKDGWSKVAAAFPSNALADEILIDHAEKIRALFVIAGNPVRSIPGPQINNALKALDLVVSIDMFKNETAEYADYILPATGMLERADYPISWSDLRASPHAQFTRAIVPPAFERREEWEILSDLAIACGSSPFGLSSCEIVAHLNRLLNHLPGEMRVTPERILDQVLKGGKQTSLKELKAAPQGIPLAPPEIGCFLGARVPTPDGKVEMAPEALIKDLARLEAVEKTYLENAGLRLIGQRERKTHNTWMHRAPHNKNAKSNYILMHPDDASARGIENDTRVTVSVTGHEWIVLPVRISESIMQGVVAIPHGWGQEKDNAEGTTTLLGADVNNIIPGGTRFMEPTSGQAIMLGHEVEIQSTEKSNHPQP